VLEPPAEERLQLAVAEQQRQEMFLRPVYAASESCPLHLVTQVAKHLHRQRRGRDEKHSSIS
jgi:hypothetical protein